MKKYDCASPEYTYRHRHHHPHIENKNNPIITIVNRVRCNGDGDDSPEVLPEAAIMDYTYGEFDCVGDDFEKAGQLEFTLASPDPIKITCNVNWIYEPFGGYPGSGCPSDSPEVLEKAVAEFVLTKTVTDNLGKTLLAETEIARATDAAPGIYAPTTTFLSNLDTDAGLYPDGYAVYKLYVRSTKAYIRTMEPFLFLARQYPYNDIPETPIKK